MLKEHPSVTKGRPLAATLATFGIWRRSVHHLWPSHAADKGSANGAHRTAGPRPAHSTGRETPLQRPHVTSTVRSRLTFDLLRNQSTAVFSKALLGQNCNGAHGWSQAAT